MTKNAKFLDFVCTFLLQSLPFSVSFTLLALFPLFILTPLILTSLQEEEQNVVADANSNTVVENKNDGHVGGDAKNIEKEKDGDKTDENDAPELPWSDVSYVFIFIFNFKLFVSV